MSRSFNSNHIPTWSMLRCWLLVAMAAIAITAPGCSCRQETPQERAAREQREAEEAERRKQEQEQKRKKPLLELGSTMPQPSADESPLPLVKPGHWMTVEQKMKPNYEDWIGESTIGVVDGSGQPIPIDRTAFTLRTSRDVALSKGQEKRVASVLYVPAAEGALAARTSLRERGGGLTVPPARLPLVRMAPHQHHFLILAKEPGRYGYFGTTYAVNAAMSSKYEDLNALLQMDRQYRVLAPAIDERIPLPNNPLCWTSVAYVLWDEVDPQQLEPAQKTALVDWLQWGGQLIINGPDSLDLLADSFLDPYLPADSGGARNITAEDLEPLDETWTVARQGRRLEPVADWSGINLRLRPEATPLAAASDLFAERRVGRGRIIVSAMQLAERSLVNWQGGFENLLNNLLLRRPPRQFAWDAGAYDNRTGDTGRVYVAPTMPVDPPIDADGNSTVRYFTRDSRVGGDRYAYTVSTATGFSNAAGDEFASSKINIKSAGAGPAAWDDFNAVATAARDSLREAAGVDVPGTQFVVLCLVCYLTALVPFNWFFFRALGRVELAWVAAPLIALLGTWVVVKQAQLDIGFVRAQAEVAILETQPNYPRGHLTRYMSFYTSLSTTYDLEFDDPTSIVAPFARSDRSPLRASDLPTPVTFQKLEKARLQGLTVSSNTTDLAHAEQMIDLGDVLRLDADRNRLVNQSEYNFRSLAIVRRPLNDSDDNPQLLGCWIGSLDARSSTSASFAPISLPEDLAAFHEERTAELSLATTTDEDRLDLEPLFAIALDPRRIAPGETRAVGRLAKVLPGVNANPRASQLRGATLVVAHLAYGPLPAPVLDANAPIDVTPRR